MAMNLKTCFIASMYKRLLKFKEPTQGKGSYYNLKLEIAFFLSICFPECRYFSKNLKPGMAFTNDYVKKSTTIELFRFRNTTK